MIGVFECLKCHIAFETEINPNDPDDCPECIFCHGIGEIQFMVDQNPSAGNLPLGTSESRYPPPSRRLEE